MKKVLFLHTHVGSGYRVLLEQLDKTPKFQSYSGYAPFKTYEDLTQLTSNKHKLGNVSAVYVHPLLKNEEWVYKRIRDAAKNIFLIASPEISFSEIYGQYDDGIGYYAFRLKGLYELAKQTKDKIIVTPENLVPLEEYLGVKLNSLDLGVDSLPEDLQKAGDIKYRKYVGMFKEI